MEHNLTRLEGEKMFKIPKEEYTAEFKELSPICAAAAISMSSVSVVTNALRLRRTQL